MHRDALTLSLVVLATAPLLAAPLAAATTMANYHQVATEHDDLGRSEEPDGLMTTVLGGEPVRNRMLDTDLDGVAEVPTPPPWPGGGRVLAPGCSDDAGRQPSGLCGLWTIGATADAAGGAGVPPGTAGVPGMTGAHAPGYTATKTRPVRFLDLQIAAATTHEFRMFEVNRKLADLDAATGGVLAGLGLDETVLGPSSLWAWYGEWRDLNGNGVIDHLVDANGYARGGNEFRWVGDCDPARGDCIPEPGTTLPVWLWPGEHHQYCGVLIACYPMPADYPGRNVVCFVADADDTLRNMLWCPPERTGASDPLLGGAQEGIEADGVMRDRTGHGDPALRMWTYGVPPMWFYDQSLLVSLVVVGGVGEVFATAGLATTYRLGELALVDVDRHEAASPLLESLLQHGVKPTLGGAWGFVRDAYAPLLRTVDGLAHQRAVDETTHPLGGLDDAVRDPGWSREPNHPDDRYPGIRFRVHAPSGDLDVREQDHRGWRNDYSAHDGAWHAWADVHTRRVNYLYGGGFGYRDSASMLPVAGGPLVPDPNDHARTLDPGVYMVDGYVGAWKDLPHAMEEAWVDPLTFGLGEGPLMRHEAYTVAPDGWVGNLVETTGASRARGYDDTTCTIAGVTASYPWAWCNPYVNTDVAEVDGQAAADQSFGLDLSDPQDPRHRLEFVSHDPEGPLPPVQVLVEGGVWDLPVLVWRDYYGWDGASAPDVELLTGHVGAIELAAVPDLMHGLRFATTDLLILPIGNQGRGITTVLDLGVRMFHPGLEIDLDERVVDVDTYAPWGTPGGR